MFPTDFSVSGQFGDSFGPLSALMASIAAIGAWSAVAIQKKELEQIEADAKIQAEKQESRDAENKFFQLLSAFDDIIKSIDYVQGIRGGRERTNMGRDAIRLFRDDVLRDIVRFQDHETRSERYRIWFDQNVDDFAHYFRYLYHFISWIDMKSPNAAWSMVFLRAKLSEPELCLLALNCMYGEGRDKFKWYIEKYSLLHNLSEKSLELLDAKENFSERAFSSGMSSRFLGAVMEDQMRNLFGEEFLISNCGYTADDNYLSTSTKDLAELIDKYRIDR